MSFKLIQTINLSSSDLTTISFTSIPQDGSDLMIIASLRSTSSSGLNDLIVNFNGFTTNQSSVRVEGDGAAMTVATRTELRANNEITSSAAANYGNAFLYINDYASTSMNKTIDYFTGGETGATTAHMNLLAGRWTATNAITRVDLVTSGNFFTADSTASLYKITKP